MKKIYYIANIRIPTEKAHGIQIMKMCEAFASQGAEVELVIPKRKTHIQEDPYAYYVVENNFGIKKLWCLDVVKWGFFGYWVELLTFAERAAWYVLLKDGVFYTRDEFLAFYLKLFGKEVIWEAHMGQKNIFVWILIKLRVFFVVISNGLKDLYVKMGVFQDNILVAPDAVDLDKFNISLSKEEAREKLGLSQDKKLVVYSGSEQPWKGTSTLRESAKLLSEGVEVIFVTNRPYSEVPLYLKSADLLVIPNSGKEDISRLYTSPMKVFEYMASGTPIVASDLPSIREVLDDSTAYFFTADDQVSLAKVINKVLINYDETQVKAEKALEVVRQYSWKKRAENILDFIHE